MKITVLMSAYNGQQYLKDAIDSILNQSYHDFELLIIDDSSNDNGVDIIRSYQDNRIRLICNQKNIGLTKSLNIGLREAKGKYIARIDVDDIMDKDRLLKQYNYLKNNLQISLVGAFAEIIDEKGNIQMQKTNPTEHEVIKMTLLFANSFVHSSIFFRKNDILKIGGYNKEYRYSQDFELYSKLIQNHELANIPEYLIKHRIHNKRLSAKYKKEQKTFAVSIIHKNINNYYKITFDEAKKIHEAYYGYINNKKKLDEIIYLYKNIFNKFLKQNNLNQNDKITLKKYFNEKILNRIKKVNLNKKNIFKKIYLFLKLNFVKK